MDQTALCKNHLQYGMQPKSIQALDFPTMSIPTYIHISAKSNKSKKMKKKHNNNNNNNK